MRTFMLCLIAVAAPSCGSGVSVSTDRASYALSSTIDVTLKLHNASTQSRAYDLCGARLEKLEGTKWVAAAEAQHACAASQPFVVSWGFVSTVRSISGVTAPGEYRLVAFHFVDSADGSAIVIEEAPSNTFDLIAP